MELFEKIVDLQTGEETMRPYTADEIAEVEAEIAKTQARLAEQDKAQQARQAVLDKLGITAEEATALFG
jgi:AmiR/NasT family two-component response regulator